MRYLNENCVYSLEDLTRDEKIELGNNIFKPENLDNVFKFPYIRYDKEFKTWLTTECAAPTTNAKELFYTLENVQVDCSELSEEQIKQMADVSEKAGYNYYDNDIKYALKVETDNIFFMIAGEESNKFIIVDGIDTEKKTITYEQFMELFGRKEENFKKLVEVLSEELTEEYNKQQYEVTMIAEQPKHPLTPVFNKVEEIAENMQNALKAYKETSNKLNYELDFNFITQLAERMAQNKHKYEPYNWQKLDDIDELKQALFRHVLEVMKGNYEDDSRLFGHIESIALNCMFINYQLNK